MTHEEGMAVTIRRRRFTLDEYHRMGEAGILGEDDRVELIEGEIVEMTPIGREHASVVARIQHFFSTRVVNRAIVWTQNPLLLGAQISEPQPDVAGPGEMFSPVAFPDVTVRAADLLG